MKKHTKKQVAKIMSYKISTQVLEALEEIMSREGHKTMHAAIDLCILQRKTLREALVQEESDSNKLFHEKMEMEDSIYTLIKCLRKMDLQVVGNKKAG